MTTISCKVSEQEKELLVNFAVENDLSMSQVVRKALKEFFAKIEAEKAGE